MSVGSVILTTNQTKGKKYMAHNLEMENGEVAFALRGAPAWHNLANRILQKMRKLQLQQCLKKQS